MQFLSDWVVPVILNYRMYNITYMCITSDPTNYLHVRKENDKINTMQHSSLVVIIELSYSTTIFRCFTRQISFEV